MVAKPSQVRPRPPTVAPTLCPVPTTPPSSPPRRPFFVHGLGRRPSAVHPLTSPRRRTPLPPAHDAQLGTALGRGGRPHPRNARVHARTPRRTPQPTVRRIRLPLGPPPRFLCTYPPSLMLAIADLRHRSSPTAASSSPTSSPSSTQPRSRSLPPPNSNRMAGRRRIYGALRSSRGSTLP